VRNAPIDIHVSNLFEKLGLCNPPWHLELLTGLQSEAGRVLSCVSALTLP
jgi:hypothetical protein